MNEGKEVKEKNMMMTKKERKKKNERNKNERNKKERGGKDKTKEKNIKRNIL